MADNKAALIREMLEDGLSPKEIKAELKEDGVEVTSQYIYNVKRRMKETRRDDDDEDERKPKSKRGKKDPEMDEEDDEDDAEGDYFTRIPKEKRRTVEFEDYECGGCGATWRAPRNKYQARCPECGVDLE